MIEEFEFKCRSATAHRSIQITEVADTEDGQDKAALSIKKRLLGIRGFHDDRFSK